MPRAFIAMNKSILQRIRELRESVGISINENELTALIKARADLTESGFRFLMLYDSYALFEVPNQDISKWYREDGWLSEEKEKILYVIAEKLKLEIFEPPDYAKWGNYSAHHHFELQSGTRKVITVHPKFLKILIPDYPIISERDILSQLSSLYE